MSRKLRRPHARGLSNIDQQDSYLGPRRKSFLTRTLASMKFSVSIPRLLYRLIESCLPKGLTYVASKLLTIRPACVMHCRLDAFGDYIKAVRPERRLDVSKEKRKEMNGTTLHFGMGARTFIGRSISLPEIHEFLRRFEVSYHVASTAILAVICRRFSLHTRVERGNQYKSWLIRQRQLYNNFKSRS